MNKLILPVLFNLLFVVLGMAQNKEHKGHSRQQESKQTEHSHKKHHMMPGSFFPDLPMGRNGSGTNWHPDSSPMAGVHKQIGGWGVMFHGAVFLRYSSHDLFDSGSRGENEVSAPNWFMLSGQRQLGKRSQLLLRTMLTFEPITEGGRGYPLLFQTGETHDGQPLIDRQHPHDLLAEMALAYTYSFVDSVGFYLYLGFPGEPALGPPTFMHRPSARHNPNPPIAHHWQDASHITFGVATLGLRHQNLKLDVSVFTGREPNEERYLFDRPRFDSFSARLSANATEHLAIQFSRAFLKSPEELFPDQDQWRTTASVLYNQQIRPGGNLAAALIWGVNSPANQTEPEATPSLVKSVQNLSSFGPQHVPASTQLHSVLLESDLKLGRQAYFTRLEVVEKSVLDLGLTQLGDKAVNIAALTLGTARELISLNHLNMMLGVQGTFYRVPGDIQSVYGKNPMSLEVYLRLSPNLMN